MASVTTASTEGVSGERAQRSSFPTSLRCRPGGCVTGLVADQRANARRPAQCSHGPWRPWPRGGAGVRGNAVSSLVVGAILFTRRVERYAGLLGACQRRLNFDPLGPAA